MPINATTEFRAAHIRVYRVKSAEGKASVLQGYPGGFMSWSEALLWGAVIVALVLGVLAAAYFLIQYFMFA